MKLSNSISKYTSTVLIIYNIKYNQVQGFQRVYIYTSHNEESIEFLTFLRSNGIFIYFKLKDLFSRSNDFIFSLEFFLMWPRIRSNFRYEKDERDFVVLLSQAYFGPTAIVSILKAFLKFLMKLHHVLVFNFFVFPWQNQAHKM